MTEDEFRGLALGMAGAVEGSHRGHADFRREGKVFASLGYPKAGWAMVKVRVDQQAVLLDVGGGVFVAAAGAWGRGGSTMVRLEGAEAGLVGDAVRMAFEG